MTRGPAGILFRLTLFSMAAFFVLTVIAMLVYDGGSADGPAHRYYSFTANPFSDLGRLRTFLGASNFPSNLLFPLAMISAGTGMASFALALPLLLSRGHRSRLASRVAAVQGLLAGLCFVGVGFTPWDQFNRLHMAFVLAAFPLYLLMVLIAAAICFRHTHLPRIIPWLFLLFAPVLLGYVLILVAGILQISPLDSLAVQVIAQKVIVYTTLGLLLVQSVLLPRAMARSLPHAIPGELDPAPAFG